MFNSRLRELRSNAKLTQKELGDVLSVANNTIANYESGYRTPDYETLVKIADYFDVSLDYLLGRESKQSAIIIKDNEAKYYDYLEKEYWDLIKKLNVVEIKVLKSIVEDGISLLDLNNALKALEGKKSDGKSGK